MTAREVIRGVDEKMHNVYTEADKVAWVLQAERMVQQLLERCGREQTAQGTGGETVLSAQAPYDALYARWLEAQLHYASQEYLKFNNAMALFSALWQEYANFIRRASPAVGRRRFF